MSAAESQTPHTPTAEEQKANRKLWVEALRSGRYRQTTHFLHSDGGFCCLGVLACVAGKTTEDLGEEEILCDFPDVMTFVGLDDPSGTFIRDTDEDGVVYGELAALNDSGKSFEQIADIIESEPPGLFVESASDWNSVLPD